MINLRKLLFFWFLFFVGIAANAQIFKAEGVVIDSLTKEKLAFVNIIVNNNGTFGTTTDIDGNFSIKSRKEINTLTFSYVGYHKKTISIDELKSNRKIRLSPENIQLQEVVVHAGENPAHRIIDSLVKNRRKNNPENLKSYSYTIYDRMVFTMDTTNLTDSMFVDFNKLVRNNDLIVMETVSELYHQKPNGDKREVKASLISGLNNPMYFYILDGVQSMSFYDDFITVFNRSYVNPITPGSKSRYFFGLESVMPTPEGDSIYTISFKPRRGVTFDALKGVMNVTSDGWAVVNVKAEAADKSNTLDVKIQQLYSKIEGVWFPVQLNTDITILRMVASGNSIAIGNNPQNTNTSLNGVGKSYISNIQINPVIDKKVFGPTDIEIADNSVNRDQDFWKEYRQDSLNKRIANTHRIVDSLVKESGIDVDKILNSANDIFTDGVIPIGFVGLRLGDMVSYNIANKFYLGLGLQTNDRLSKSFNMGGYFGYWFGSKHPSYGGEMNYNMYKKRDLKLRLAFDHMYVNVGYYGFMNRAYNPLDDNCFKYYYVKWTSLNTTAAAELSMRFAKILQGSVKFSLSDKEMYDWYSYQTGADTYKGIFRVSALDFTLRIAPGERYILTPKGLATVKKGKPEILISYQKSLKGVLDNPFNFDKIQIQLKDSWKIRYWGKTSVTLQAGYVFGDAPLFELFNIFGTNNGFGVYAPESFATMKINEFFCDRFVILFFRHNFGKFFKTKLFSPEFIFETNIGWGDISDTQKHSGLDMKSMKDGYYESGLVIDDILNISTTHLGFGAYYRYGANSFDKTEENFAFKLKVSVGF